MQWSARDLDGMSLWQFHHIWEGWRTANCPPEAPEAPTAEEHETADWSF